MLSEVAARGVFAAILDREFNSHVFMVQSYWIGDFKSRMRGHFLELSSTQPFPGNFAVFQTVWNGYRLNEYKRRRVYTFPAGEFRN